MGWSPRERQGVRRIWSRPSPPQVAELIVPTFQVGGRPQLHSREGTPRYVYRVDEPAVVGEHAVIQVVNTDSSPWELRVNSVLALDVTNSVFFTSSYRVIDVASDIPIANQGGTVVQMETDEVLDGVSVVAGTALTASMPAFGGYLRSDIQGPFPAYCSVVRPGQTWEAWNTQPNEHVRWTLSFYLVPRELQA